MLLTTYMDLLYSALIGYAFGNILPASILGHFKNKNPFDHGSGNPGMTNTIKIMGKSAGAIVLIGDILKTAVAILLCEYLFPHWGHVIALYTGIGVMLGHCFPIWHHFEGGKGVAVVCATYILYAPLPGIVALASGGIALLLKKGVKVAAAIIPLVYCVWMLFHFTWLSYLPALAMGLLMAWLNLRPNRLQQPALESVEVPKEIEAPATNKLPDSTLSSTSSLSQKQSEKI